MSELLLLLRWSWRDLRANWIKVAAIALVIALGTGAYAGLTSTANWRRLTNQASYELVNVHDLRVELAEGSVVARGDLAAAARSIESSDQLTGVEERYVVDVLIDASTAERDILVRGVVIGADLSDGGPRIDRWFNDGGRDLTSADTGRDVVILEHSFARFHDLPEQGTLTVRGGTTLTYVGRAMHPEFFIVAPDGQIFMAEGTYAALFSSLETAQQLGGSPGVNDLVVTVADGGAVTRVADEIESAIARRLGVGAEAEPLTDNTVFRALTEDVENDQQVFNLFSFLLIAGAVAGAFNLINRLVEQQRREIGAAMALGARPLRIAIRPLLVGAQIALLGVVFGVGFGLLIGNAMRTVLVEFLPLPSWQTPFQTGVFLRVAAVGFLVPFAAAAWPVWRAVRVPPAEAIRPMHLTGRTKKGPRRLRHLALPGGTFALMPFRNLARARRRTITTVLAVAAVITVLVGFLGMVDSFLITLDRASAETLQDAPDRIEVELAGFYDADSAEVAAILDAPSVGRASAGVQIGAYASGDAAAFPLLLNLLDLQSAVWVPTTGGAGSPEGGLILADTAADALGVGPGDTVSLRFPVRTGPRSFTLETSEVPVTGVYPYPIRSFAYADVALAPLFGLDGAVNRIDVVPAAGSTATDVTRDLLDLGTVTSVQPVAGAVESIRGELSSIVNILTTIGFAAFALALLIAFNSASISLDERFRDHATMFAFGVRVRTALRMAMTESALIGVVATAIGILGGLAMVWWVTSQLLAETLPDFGVAIALEPATLLVAVLLGVAAVALAPLFTVRRMRRIDLPATLRLME